MGQVEPRCRFTLLGRAGARNWRKCEYVPLIRKQHGCATSCLYVSAHGELRATLMYKAAVTLKDSDRRNPADAQVRNHSGVGQGIADSRNFTAEVCTR